MKDSADKKSMSPAQRQAKMDVLKELMDMAQDEMGKKVKTGMDELHKVTVAAPDAESLTEGLKIAENILPEENINPEVEELTPSEDTIVSEPEVLEATETISADEDDEDDDIFSRKKKTKSKMQSLMDEE